MLRCWAKESSTLGECSEQIEEVGQRHMPDQSGVMSQRLSLNCSIKYHLCVDRVGWEGESELVGWSVHMWKGEDSGRSEGKVSQCYRKPVPQTISMPASNEDFLPT